MPHRHIRSDADLKGLCRLFEGLGRPFTVEWTVGENRSLQQNRLQHLWAREAAEQLGDRTAEEQRDEWKLRFGVPIMREASEQFRETYDSLIKPLPYAYKLKAMHLIEVTSLMNVRQMVAYLDCIERECAEQGLRLTDPNPDLAKYQDRYRNRREAA